VLATQIGLGILNVVWALPLINATLHNVVGALLLLTVVTVNFAPSLHRNA
jgi:cytochrome c oxidase assembly protein subunit 15